MVMVQLASWSCCLYLNSSLFTLHSSLFTLNSSRLSLLSLFSNCHQLMKKKASERVTWTENNGDDEGCDFLTVTSAEDSICNLPCALTCTHAYSYYLLLSYPLFLSTSPSSSLIRSSLQKYIPESYWTHLAVIILGPTFSLPCRELLSLSYQQTTCPLTFTTCKSINFLSAPVWLKAQCHTGLFENLFSLLCNYKWTFHYCSSVLCREMDENENEYEEKAWRVGDKKRWNGRKNNSAI